ncbi:FHA domain-containing protein [Streptomyces sp. NPDC051567]|uniref:ABC transporter ATP-binding protein/permease n=1 Tax=Streptomyces sp. NPDC051567 TaxID=3365660 RepID=UPI0037AE6C17
MPEVVLEVNGRTWTLDPSRSYVLGRDPQGDVVLEDARVSWRHATLAWTGQGWEIEDHGSTNGTYAQGARVQRAAFAPGTPVRLGNATDGPRLDAVAPPYEPAAHQPYAHQPQQGWQQPAQAPQQYPYQQEHHEPQSYTEPHQYTQPQSQQQYQVPHQAQQQVPQQVQAQQQAHAHAQAQTQLRAQVPYQPSQPQPQPHAYPQVAAPGPAPGEAGADRTPTTFHLLALGHVMRIGRALENELVVSDLQVSRHHAEFRSMPGGRFEIHDLGSHNGTYVNGQPLSKSTAALLGPDDVVGVGRSTFRIVGDRLEEFVDTGAVSFSARHLTVTVDGGKQILRDVTFGVPEKSLIGVIGPSGSGKSTLLKALTGYRPADEGEVLYDNRDLYKQFAELRRRIGLVPQDDILHKELSVRTALTYAAKLRFPGDTAGSERAARIDEVLRELKLDLHENKKIASLSGGQRKRVSVALELLTKPSLIFLDEPTSGLDPGMDRDVMQLLRALADDGRTVLVVTHSVAELALCDKLLVMAPGGSVAYFGPPDEALNFFGYTTWADVFSAFENYREYDWAGRWKGSQHYQLHAADLDAVAPQPVSAPAAQVRPPEPQGWGAQLGTLIRRYVSVIASDKGFIGLMVILPAVLGVVSTLVPAPFGLAAPTPPNPFNGTAGTIMLILTVGMCLSGAANSVRELIKERVIYERERATGLSRSAYLMSKVIVLGAVTAVQGLIICGIGFFPRELPEQGLLLPPAVELCLSVIALGFTSMMFGLVISSLVRTSEKTMPLLVMFAIVQIVFTGVLFQVYDSPGLEQFAWLMPARWAVAATGTTLDLAALMPPWDRDAPSNTDPLWEATAGQWGLNVTVLLLLGVACGFVVSRLLRRHEPEVMRK